MPKIRGRGADRDHFWRDAIAARMGSGQTVTAYCAARVLGESTFFAKRRELTRRDRSPDVPAPPAPNTSFAAARLISDPTVEIVVPVGADPAAVARLILALRGMPC